MSRFIANAAVAGLIAFAASTQAQTPVLTDFPATFFANIIQSTDFSEENVFLGLQAIVQGQIDSGRDDLEQPTPFASDYLGGPIAAGDYLVLYYDGPEVPPDGAGDPDLELLSAPGAFDIYFFDAPASGFSVPDPGEGIFGNGELRFARLYDHVPTPGVPDGGTTLALLGLSLSCFALIRRRA